MPMAGVRTREPVREQAEMLFKVPDDALPGDHSARLLWQVVGHLDLSPFVANAKSLVGDRGRDTLSVRMLLTLWLYAIAEGIGSARELERRLATDVAFRWIIGDQSVGRTKLAQFRVAHREALERVFAEVLASLTHKGLLSLNVVAQDGTRIRASASAPSFRRLASLAACLEQAKLHVKAVLAEGDDPEMGERVRRAREAAARDYEERVNEAIATAKQLAQERRRGPNRNKRSREPRASTTDPEARVMKMGDGGFRPAYNVQLATAGSPMGGASTIVGLRVTNDGFDMGALSPMLDDIERRTGRLPSVLLADAGHADHASIRAAAERGVTALIPVPERERGSQVSVDPAIVAWRERMQTDEAKQAFRARASLCELPNAHFKTRLGLGHLLVRGLSKVTCVVLLTALAANILANAQALVG
jgi:transposase